MRRRDVPLETLTCTGFPLRPRVLCTGVSVAAHVGLLLTLVSVQLTTVQPVEFIRVSLRPGGGRGEALGGPPSIAAAIAAPERIVAHPMKPRQAQPIRKIARRKPPRQQLDPAPVAAAGAPSTTSVAASVEPGGAAGSGGGAGGETGHGVGSGTGDDTRPYCTYCPEPTYPLLARRRGWKGTVDVGLILLADGRVDAARLRRSSGYDVLDREAIEVAQRSRFHLPQQTATPLHGRIEYRFELLPAR